ncbi:MAG: methionyl-tRNA formyltransferase, partial [Novosphingobium sp.]|nr:methionyl-tRNA formyltransferase [Novosphingobium sp.]
LKAFRADVYVVAAFGQILPQAVLDLPAYGCINVHASLLPRWRGAAPIQAAILAGDAQSGITIMQMDAGLDTGPMLAMKKTPVDGKTAGELSAELARIGGRLLVEVLADLAAWPPRPQSEEGATYARKIDKSETRLDFSQAAEQVERQVRAFSPMPGAWFELAGTRFKVLRAEVVPGMSGTPGLVLDDRLTIACGTGALRPTRIQRAGKPAMAVADMLRGHPIPAGTQIDMAGP